VGRKEDSVWRIDLKQTRYAPLIFLLLLLFPAAAVADEKIHEFTVLQMNDTYDLFPVPTEIDHQTLSRGGLAHAATLIKEKRKQGPTLLLHAGDLLFPSLLSNKLKHQGAQMITALNLLQVDLATFGNHEFDQGCRVLADRLAESIFPWVSANVDLPQEANLPDGKVRPYRIIKIAGLRAGIFGLTLALAPVGGCGPTPITFREPIEAAREVVARLKKEKVDLIIALTHLPMAEDRALAEAFPEIDLIVGGHDHEVMEALVGRTLITKAGENATGLGVIGIEAGRSRRGWVIEKSWRRLPVDPAHVPADPKMEAALKPYAEEITPFNRVIGEAAVPLDLREETVREQESNFGNYVADVLRSAMGADAALINGGAFRDDRILKPGPIRLRDLYTALPFDNRMVLIEITGKQLMEAFENGVSMAEKRAGRFPQVSGISFTFDPRQPVGDRVTEVKIGGEPIEPDRIYTLATVDFLARKGEIDGYAFRDLPILKAGGNLNEAIIKHLESMGPIKTKPEGRIVQMEND
jgi:5'-nucleotidase